MSTLLLRLAAPMQSWGTDSKFDIRRTARVPSKSGVIGIIAAALGRKRDNEIDDLVQLKFGVRVDREGSLMKDFHMANAKKTSYATTRYYLADAVFLAGLESDDDAFLSELDYALNAPAFPLYLGRRSCPPTLPLSLGIRPVSLRSALIQEPMLTLNDRLPICAAMRIILEDSDGVTSGRLHDVPVSFSQENRRYGWRSVSIETICVGIPEHNPMEELR